MKLEKRGIFDSWKSTPVDKRIIKTELDLIDTPTPVPDKRFKTPTNYAWSRPEMPAWMTNIKGEIFKATGKYPMADQTDEEIEQDITKFMELIRKNGPGSKLTPTKALELMKTPEGKAIYRAVEKASPKQDRRYA